MCRRVPLQRYRGRLTQIKRHRSPARPNPRRPRKAKRTKNVEKGSSRAIATTTTAITAATETVPAKTMQGHRRVKATRMLKICNVAIAICTNHATIKSLILTLEV